MKSALRAISLAIGIGMTTTYPVAQTAKERAWSTIDGGLTNKSWEKRAKVLGVLSKLTGDKRAEESAITALTDERDEVRGAAAQALGEMRAKSAVPQLLEMVGDKEPGVILAAARSLITLGDNRGYNVFYDVLTGQMKSGSSLTDQQKKTLKKTLKDTKKMVGIGLQAGIGFIPYGGLALGGFKQLTKDDASPVLAAAALTLARDPDPKSGQALADAATSQQKWLVRAAAYDAIATRGDPSLLHVAADGLEDKQDEVQYSAAGAVIRLSDIQANAPARKSAPAKRFYLR